MPINTSRLMIFMVVLIASCGSNKELVSYEISGEKTKVTIGHALEDFRKIYNQITPQDIEQMNTNEGYFRMIALARLVTPYLLIHEARELSNYTEDPLYIASIKQQEKLLPYHLAFREGQKILDKKLGKSKVELAEVSRIMLTNSKDPIANRKAFEKAEEILETLQKSTNLVLDFADIAEKESQEPLGTQSGGYLYQIVKGAYPVLDDVVFNQKYEGLYPDLIQDDKGIYIVFVHTKVKKENLDKLDQYTASTVRSKMEHQYIADNTEYQFFLTNDKIMINNQLLDPSEVDEDTKIVKFWNKAYTLKEMKSLIAIFNGGKEDSIDNKTIFDVLSPMESDGMRLNVLTYQMGLLFKGYNTKITNSKEYKKTLKEEHLALELNTVYQIVSKDLYKDMITNVADKELSDFYKNEDNRVIKSYNNLDEPIYLTLQESKKELERKIVGKRAEDIRNESDEKMTEKYKILWNKKNVEILQKKVIAEYHKFEHPKT